MRVSIKVWAYVRFTYRVQFRVRVRSCFLPKVRVRIRVRDIFRIGVSLGLGLV